MEATGVYSQRVAHFLYTSGCRVSVVNAAKINFFARSNLRRGKTDSMDAELIAQYALNMKPVTHPNRTGAPQGPAERAGDHRQPDHTGKEPSLCF
ncbi:IS110 family transposase [Deinococcus misasensis]|uniref:IS110 family transposase n=1 Tax=Deinococcus misasensis TaxID=392413 RepID=UPI000A04D93A|nr:transposase [Deinococcus misasensis]